MDDDFDDALLPGTIVPNKMLPEIGVVAVYYSYLDNVLSRAIWALLGLRPDRGRIVTTTASSFASRVEIFTALARQKYGDDHKRRLTALSTNLRSAGDDRNRLFHDEVLSSENPDEHELVTLSTIRVNPITQAESAHRFDPDTMRDLQQRLQRLYEIIGAGRKGWLTAPLPSLEKSPTQLLLQANNLKQKPERSPRQPKASPASRRKAAIAKRGKS